MDWLDGQDLGKNIIRKSVRKNICRRSIQINLSKYAKAAKIFVSHVNAPHIVTSSEKEFNNQVGRMTHPG